MANSFEAERAVLDRAERDCIAFELLVETAIAENTRLVVMSRRAIEDTYRVLDLDAFERPARRSAARAMG